MKKFYAIVLSLALIISLAACKKTENDNTGSSIISSDIMVDNNTTESTNSIGNDSSPSSSTDIGSTDTNTDVIYFESSISKYASIEFKDEKGNVLLTASDVSKVYAKQIETEGYTIQLDFTPDGTKKFENATRNNLGKKIAIYIDDELIIEPVVVTAITDGKVIINGLGTKEDMLKMYEKLTSTEVPKPTTLPLPQDVTKFIFASGAGAWGTVLDLNKNGDFSGNYHDSEMGENADEYPDGTVYLSVFTGKFTNFEKINDYSYKMTVADVKTRDEVGKEWIEQGIRYVATAPHGIEGGTEFILYLPQTPVSELPEEFLYWWPARFEGEENPTTLSYYGILNVSTNDGFFTYEKA